MFLHKQGCKYYQLVFKNLEHETKAVMNGNRNSTMSVYNLLSNHALNPLPHLVELLKHIDNIDAHITSEENVLNGFVNKLHSITFIDMHKKATDPEFAQLAEITSRLSRIEQEFRELKNKIVEVIGLIERSKQNNPSSSFNVTVEALISHYPAISRGLDNIFSASSNLAREFQKYAATIQQEKELIITEEQSATDFNKNFISWFS